MRPFKIDRMMHSVNPRTVCRRISLGGMQCLLALLALFGADLSTLAQVDTVEVRIWGGQQDDRGVRLIQLADGDLLSLSSTNSTSTNQPQAWVQRIDSNAHVVWESTLSDSPLLQPVDAVEHEDGRITVLSMRYASAADGYDWHWQTLAPDGTPQSSLSWGTAAWDLPLRCFDRSGELWSVGTTYASGSGDVQWTRHVWANENWMLSDAAAWGTEQEEVVTDAMIVGDTLLVSATLEAEQRASFTAYDLISGETTWTYSSVWDEPTSSVALDVRDTTVAGLMNVETADGIRLAFVCLSLSGDTLLEKIPGSGVDVEAYDLQWYSCRRFCDHFHDRRLGFGGRGIALLTVVCGRTELGRVAPRSGRLGMNDRRACSATPQNGFGCLAARMVIQTVATMFICFNFQTPLLGIIWGMWRRISWKQRFPLKPMQSKPMRVGKSFPIRFRRCLKFADTDWDSAGLSLMVGGGK